MKCSNCGAEIANNSKSCEFCGSKISTEMQREQEQLNKVGCPKCGSSNVTFNREKQGEVKGKTETAVVHNTVGVCKDCGNTWYTTENGPVKKRKTWLWVLGWIFIFPVPLTILMLRPTNKLDKKIRYAIIVIVWIVYAVWIYGSKDSNKDTLTADNTPVVETTKEESKTKPETEKFATEEATEETTEEATEETTEEKTGTSENKSDTSGVDPDLKAFLDSYEAYMDEYCEFMEKYDSSDATMILQYAEMIKKYDDLEKKAEAYDSDTMSATDSAYYLEVMTRINAKLADVADTQ